MATGKFICRVCGKEYGACLSAKTAPGKYHWQEVACSPECGSIYLQRVIASRIKVEDDLIEEEVVEESVGEPAEELIENRVNTVDPKGDRDQLPYTEMCINIENQDVKE